MTEIRSAETRRGVGARAAGDPKDPNDADAPSELREKVRAHYAEAALAARKAPASCCSSASAVPCCDSTSGSESSCGYAGTELSELPREAVAASLGCGNPTALADLREGEVVLDLGSGGGIDVLLSARRVGPGGKAYGLDMTDEMLALARENQRNAGVTNAEFLRGTIEAIPLPDASVDVVISNCVINLSTDKRRTLGEAFRVLKPGGRLAVADIVSTRPMPPAVRRVAALWAGCVAGALTTDEYRGILRDAGFEGIEIERLRGYGAQDAAALVADEGLAREIAVWDGEVQSAAVRATKPRAK
ncbi:MAG: arsenite methyltransferase [bacterium]